MKRKLFKPFIVLAIVALFSGCTDDDPDPNNLLDVKFVNSENSEYTINYMEIRSRGPVGEDTAIAGEWSDNVLEGKTLNPGESIHFTFEIPNLHWSEYRVGVEDNGKTVMLHELEGYDDELPITHWGGNDRTVYVTIAYNSSTESIYVQGWGDNVGID